jgi:hypothetical protein
VANSEGGTNGQGLGKNPGTHVGYQNISVIFAK